MAFFPLPHVALVYFTELNQTNIDLNICSPLCLPATFSHEKTAIIFSLPFNQSLIYNRVWYYNQLHPFSLLDFLYYFCPEVALCAWKLLTSNVFHDLRLVGKISESAASKRKETPSLGYESSCGVYVMRITVSLPELKIKKLLQKIRDMLFMRQYKSCNDLEYMNFFLYQQNLLLNI